MFYVVYFSEFCCSVDHFFPDFGQGPFPKIAGKVPAEFINMFKHKQQTLSTVCENTYICVKYSPAYKQEDQACLG